MDSAIRWVHRQKKEAETERAEYHFEDKSFFSPLTANLPGHKSKTTLEV